MALEQFVNTVRVLSGEGNFRELADYLSKSEESLLSRNVSSLDTVLETLDVRDHSLGVAAVLAAKLRAGSDCSLERISSFVTESNPEQVKNFPVGFSVLCRLFAEECIAKERPLIGIRPIKEAISKIRPDDKTLTSLHSDLCKLCLASGCFTPVLPYLDEDYRDVSEECSSDPKYLLLFYYYGGMIYAAVKRFERSLYFFEVVVTVPSSVVSHIMLEAYKKYLLISLLVPNPCRDQQKLPKYTSPVINKFMKILCAPYHGVFAAYFNNNKAEELQLVIQKHVETFSADGNSGLIQQVVEAQIKMNIKRLTKTFLTLSLDDVASRVALSSSVEAERKLVEMIEEGSIQARISQKDGMVRFDSNDQHFDSVNMLLHLETNINNCISLDKQINLMDDEIVLNPVFVRKSVLSSRELGENEEMTTSGAGQSTSGGGKSATNSVSSGTKLPGYSM